MKHYNKNAQSGKIEKKSKDIVAKLCKASKLTPKRVTSHLNHRYSDGHRIGSHRHYFCTQSGMLDALLDKFESDLTKELKLNKGRVRSHMKDKWGV